MFLELANTYLGNEEKLMVPQRERMKTEEVQSRAWGPGGRGWDTLSQEAHG